MQMLNLQNILWVIPGVVFIYLYNRRRPNDAISLSGWPYIFFLVIIAALTWLPVECLYKSDFFNIKTFFETFDITKNTLIEDSFILLIAVIFSIILFLIAQNEKITNLIFPSTYDNFYKKCVEWENEEILLTLKNGKVYYGVLWKYPENPKSRHESQTISIAPCISGYRDEVTKKVIWNTYYPEYKDKKNLIDREIIIPRSEIITFGKFNKEVFNHFCKDNSSNTAEDTG